MFNSQQFSKDLKIQKNNYKEGFKIDFELINKHIEDLRFFNLLSLKEDNAKLAFWINVYNGLTNYWIIRKKIKTRVTKYLPFFIFLKVNIGGLLLSLDNIEHGLLRQNRSVKYPPFYQWRLLNKSSLMIEKFDYRIHFALNCGANSCPPIAFYDAENIQKHLQIAMESFVENNFLIDVKMKQIHCSKIFKMYRKDFGSLFLNDGQYKAYRIKYIPYNWNI